MADKSYVSMEQKICSICGQKYDTNSLIMDKQMRDQFEMHTVTGFGLCEEDQKYQDDDYIALVEVKNPPQDGNLSQENADRTGNIARVKRHVFDMIFNGPAPDREMVFVETGVIDKLKENIK